MNNNETHNGVTAETPLRLDIQKANAPSPPQQQQVVAVKKKRRDKSDLGPDFVAPDGGWGWVVAIATGISILVTFPVMQQFGILFRVRFAELQISSSQMTTIINMQQCVSACTGLFNGPLFRRFSFRQIALSGAVMIFFGLLVATLANSFIWYLLSISVFYGVGRGFMISASSLAVNTYFRIKRRSATAYQFAVAGLGPIVLPYISTFLMVQYGVAGAVLCYCGLSLHNIACSLIYQPVKWHVKPITADTEAQQKLTEDEIDPQQTMENNADPETPIMPRSNDGWYGSRMSLDSTRQRRHSSISSMSSFKTSPGTPSNTPAIPPRTPKISFSASKPLMEAVKEDVAPEETQFLQKPPQIEDKKEKEEKEEKQKNLSVFQRIAVFFDLDLLKDITYLNLALGLTLVAFTEINFAILTPFILAEFGFNDSEIAGAMSMLAFCDLVMRFLIPTIMGKLQVDNKMIFLGALASMISGRAIVAHTRNFYVMLACFGWMGLSKGLRVVFWNLIIPSYVPLERLPAAAGLQLLFTGIFTLTCGPIIGLIRDATNYAVTIHWMNALCILVMIAWWGEDLIRKCKQKKPVDVDTVKSMD